MDKIPDEFDHLVSEAQGQKSEEWDEERLHRFTASRFSDMMKRGRGKDDPFGVMCMSYIYEKVAEILTMSPHIATGAAIDWGNEFEEAAIVRYQTEKNVIVKRIGFLAFKEYAGGSPDGLVGKNGIIEVKCPFNPANHAKSLITGTYYKDDHDWQVQGNLMVTGREYCDFITYDPRVQGESLQLNVFRVERNEEKIQAIISRLDEVKQKLDELMKTL